MKKPKPEIDKIMKFTRKNLGNYKKTKKKNMLDIDKVMSSLKQGTPKQGVQGQQPFQSLQQQDKNVQSELKDVLKTKGAKKIEIHNHYYNGNSGDQQDEFDKPDMAPPFSVLNGTPKKQRKRDPNKPMPKYEQALRSIYEDKKDD